MIFRSVHVSLAHVTCIAVGLLVAGCGGGGTGVSGKISVNGQPLEQANIEFLPMNPSISNQFGAAVTQGAYRVDNSQQIKPGEYQVQIRAYRGMGKKVWDGMGDGTNKNMVEELTQFIPNKYNDASELKVALSSGSNNFDADLVVP